MIYARYIGDDKDGAIRINASSIPPSLLDKARDILKSYDVSEYNSDVIKEINIKIKNMLEEEKRD